MGSISLQSFAHWLGIVLMVIFIAMVLGQAVRYFRTAMDSEPLRRKKLPRHFGKVAAEALLALVASRLLLTAIAVIYAAVTGESDGIWDRLFHYLYRWDADHYIGLIENWYVTEGDPRLHLVFMPLYPILCRLLYFCGVPSLAAALIVSNLSLWGCGVVMTYLVSDRMGCKAGRRAMWLLMFCPASFFFSLPYTESLFLLMTLLAVWMARRKHFGWAVFFGALAANARIVGLAVAIPIFWEMLRDAWGDRERFDADYLKKMLLCVLRVLPVALGLAAYLMLNWELFGDPLQFLEFEKSNWGQEMGSLANTVEYTLKNAVSFRSVPYQLGTWIPQIVSIVFAMLLMAVCYTKIGAGDMAYAMVYFYMSVSPTWLLSGTRYIFTMYPLYLMLAALTKKKWKFAAMMAAECVLMGYMIVNAIFVGAVM